MAQQFRALAALAVDPDSVSSTYMAVHSHLKLLLPDIQLPLLTSVGTALKLDVDILADKTYILNFLKLN